MIGPTFEERTLEKASNLPQQNSTDYDSKPGPFLTIFDSEKVQACIPSARAQEFVSTFRQHNEPNMNIWSSIPRVNRLVQRFAARTCTSMRR